MIIEVEIDTDNGDRVVEIKTSEKRLKSTIARLLREGVFVNEQSIWYPPHKIIRVFYYV